MDKTRAEYFSYVTCSVVKMTNCCVSATMLMLHLATKQIISMRKKQDVRMQHNTCQWVTSVSEMQIFKIGFWTSLLICIMQLQHTTILTLWPLRQPGLPLWAVEEQRAESLAVSQLLFGTRPQVPLHVHSGPARHLMTPADIRRCNENVSRFFHKQ